MPEQLLNREISIRIKDLFDTQLINSIELVYFTNKDECDTCDEATQLLGELAALSDKISVSTYDVDEYPQLAQRYNL